MKGKRYKRAVKSLRWAVDQGAMTEFDAIGVLSLASLAGYFAPDSEQPSSNLVRAERLKMVKAKNSPDSLRGTKAGKLLNAARVREPSERLCEKKHALKDRRGNVVKLGGKDVETTSERELAQIGVWWKRLMQKQGVGGVVLSEWETALLKESVEKGGWVGDHAGWNYSGGPSPDDFLPREVVRKAVLDDTVSGGLFIAPVQFDAAIITIPLLNGELLPDVELRPGTGRRMMSATVNNVGMTWGVAPGTQLQPFSTSGLISELDVPLFNLQGAIEFSNDLLNDSPVTIGQTIVELFGARQKSELDKVIVSGDGVSQPQGILNATGLTVVTSDNGASGPPTVSDYEGLLFGIGKQYREKSWAPCFIGNDTSYRRARGIAVGPGDERRVFGMTEEDYELLGHPYKIQQDISNSKVLFGCLKRYRMYSRGGSEVTVTREGRALALANTTLTVVRSRWGGKVVDGASFAMMSDAQS